MDEQGVKEWIRSCLPRNSGDERSLLVWDSFRAHLTDSVKSNRKFDVAVIPGGLTPVLQPLDKCLNKPFKDIIRRKYQSCQPYIFNSRILNLVKFRDTAPLSATVIKFASFLCKPF